MSIATEKQSSQEKVDLKYTPNQMARINFLIAICELENRKNLFDTALTFFQKAANEIAGGKIIASVNEAEEKYHPLRLPDSGATSLNEALDTLTISLIPNPDQQSALLAIGKNLNYGSLQETFANGCVYLDSAIEEIVVNGRTIAIVDEELKRFTELGMSAFDNALRNREKMQYVGPLRYFGPLKPVTPTAG